MFEILLNYFATHKAVNYFNSNYILILDKKL